MLQYILVSIGGGLLFGIMDGLINANALARKRMAFIEIIARRKVNVPIGLVIDLIYGFALAGIYLLLRESLPGDTAVLKGLSYGGLMWFFRVVMGAVGQWMMLQMPLRTVYYICWTGLGEMLILGVIFGVILGSG